MTQGLFRCDKEPFLAMRSAASSAVVVLVTLRPATGEGVAKDPSNSRGSVCLSWRAAAAETGSPRVTWRDCG